MKIRLVWGFFPKDPIVRVDGVDVTTRCAEVVILPAGRAKVKLFIKDGDGRLQVRKWLEHRCGDTLHIFDHCAEIERQVIEGEYEVEVIPEDRPSPVAARSEMRE